MNELVMAMDLDRVPPPGEEGKTKKRSDDSDEEDDDEDMDDEEETFGTWFSSARAVNPAIHRTKEAILHAALTADPEAHPLGPPHPEITQYFNTPESIVQKTAKLTERLKEALDIKKVPPRQRRTANKEALREDEGYLDFDDLFGGAPSAQNTIVKDEPASPAKPGADTKPKAEPVSPVKAKPKPGRLISNERPLDDYNRLIKGEGDMFRKAITDLAAVVEENVAASFSRQAFPLALECLEAMRVTALTFEEVETYNEWVGCGPS
jgi:ATP-dependent DNA helicase 2 subunit 2